MFSLPLIIIILRCTYYVHIPSDLMLMALTIITLAMPGHHKDAHGKPHRYPFTTPGSRETLVDKMPCLGAYALDGLELTTL